MVFVSQAAIASFVRPWGHMAVLAEIWSYLARNEHRPAVVYIRHDEAALNGSSNKTRHSQQSPSYQTFCALAMKSLLYAAAIVFTGQAIAQLPANRRKICPPEKKWAYCKCTASGIYGQYLGTAAIACT